MSLPKKRKKLEDNNRGKDFPAKEAKTDPVKKTVPPAQDSRQMDKAFEIMERIDNPGSLAVTPQPGESTTPQPGKLRLKITLEGSAPLSPDSGTVSRGSREMYLGITIPSFVWKVPILKRAAQRIMEKLSPGG